MPADASVHPCLLHVVDSLETGGLERFVCDLALSQHAAGQRVAVFSLNRTEGFRGELEAGGVEVIQGDKRGGFDRALIRRLRALVRERGVAVVHSHNFVPNYYAALALLGLRCALVNTCHNMGTRLAQRRLRMFFRLSLLRTARVATVGEAARAHLVGAGLLPAARTQALDNGIPVQRFARGAVARAEARALLGLAPDARVLGCVGRLVELKNHALLLGVLPALRARDANLALVLIGDGPKRGALQQQAQALGLGDCVHFAGDRSDVARLLCAFDVFVQPSRTEGLSIALLEASAAGCAIVASRVGGNPEIVADGQRGWLFESDDAAALEALLSELLGDAAQRQRLGEAARAWAEREVGIERARARYADLYAQAQQR
ncbi:MAG: glycosyltransferase [Xanthomonadales bacterium]|nr:glycosyltransferase [Xanthomonadales bacterium]